MRRSSRWRSAAHRGLLGTAIILTFIWVLATATSDRWWWSQWILWLTSLILIPAGFCLMTSLLLARRRFWWFGSGLCLLGVMVFTAERWRPWSAEQPSGLRILQWTTGPVFRDAAIAAEALTALNADISIVEGARKIASTEVFQSWAREGRVSVTTKGPLLIASKLPIVRMRTLMWAKDTILVELVVATDDQHLKMLLVDLPSDPSRSRADIASTVRRTLSESTYAPDLLLGDFNMTASSWQLRHIAPGYQPAWPIAGTGWGGTFPRQWPVYRLDHVLASAKLIDQMSIATIDPGVGRHRAQFITLSGERPAGH